MDEYNTNDITSIPFEKQYESYKQNNQVINGIALALNV